MKKLKIFTAFLTAIIIVSGCNTPTQISEPLKSDSSLKKVQRIQYISDTTAIAFEWLSFSDSEYVIGYRIYRTELVNGEDNNRLELVATLDDKIVSHYVDTELKPDTTYKYRFTSFTDDNRESIGSKALVVKTLKVIKPIHYLIPVGGLANKVKLIWRPHKDRKVSGYIVERNDIYGQSWKKVGDLDSRLNVEFIDTGLDTNKAYRYRVRVKTFDGLVSAPSKIFDVLTKALPKPVVDITATAKLPKEIKVSWRASDEIGIRGYKVYRSEKNDGTFNLVKEVKENYYFDQIGEDGKQVFYKISAVDKSGLESILNDLPIMGNSLFKPKPPKIVNLKASESDIFISWQSTDPRTLRYKLIRESGSSWTKKDRVEIDIDKTEYLDQNVKKNLDYSYQIIAIDKYEVESIPTEKSETSLRGTK